MPRVLSQSWRGLLAAALIAAAGLCCPSSPLRADPAAAAPTSPEVVKAAYILNFIRFTEWPAEALPEGAPFVVGVSADRVLEDALIRLTDGQQVRGRRIRVVRLRTTRDLADCHLAYLDGEVTVNEEPAVSVTEALAAIGDRPVLTVSSHDEFLARGGMLNLYREGSNLRFEIAPERAAAAGLRFSSQLLRLARIVGPPRADSP